MSSSVKLLDFISSSWEDSNFSRVINHLEKKYKCCGFDNPVHNQTRCKGIANRCKLSINIRLEIPTLISSIGMMVCIIIIGVFAGLITQNELCNNNNNLSENSHNCQLEETLNQEKIGPENWNPDF